VEQPAEQLFHRHITVNGELSKHSTYHFKPGMKVAVPLKNQNH
jgi:ribosomal protein S4